MRTKQPLNVPNCNTIQTVNNQTNRKTNQHQPLQHCGGLGQLDAISPTVETNRFYSAPDAERIAQYLKTTVDKIRIHLLPKRRSDRKPTFHSSICWIRNPRFHFYVPEHAVRKSVRVINGAETDLAMMYTAKVVVQNARRKHTLHHTRVGDALPKNCKYSP